MRRMLRPPKEKQCTRCGKTKLLAEMAKRESGKPRSWCQDCMNEYMRDWRERHPGDNAQRCREWYKANRVQHIANVAARRRPKAEAVKVQ